jgi:hypothetical protein
LKRKQANERGRELMASPGPVPPVEVLLALSKVRENQRVERKKGKKVLLLPALNNPNSV